MSEQDRRMLAGIRDVKSRVEDMVRENALDKEHGAEASGIWNEVFGGIDYVRDLSEENLSKIRLHVGMFTGENVYRYWHPHPPLDAGVFAKESGYADLIREIPDDCRIGEPGTENMPIPLGVDFGGKVLNKDIVRYQSCISNLYLSGVLAGIRANSSRSIVLEIGGGYGGFSYHIRNALKGRSTCILLDFAQMLIFPGAYLSVTDPDAKIYIYGRDTFTKDFVRNGISEYDYVLLPLEAFGALKDLPSLELMINLMSFQEMKPEAVECYAGFAKDKLTGHLYSYNMDRHPYNAHLKNVSVSEILSKHLTLWPEEKFFEKKSLNSSHPWYYKSFFGVPKGSDTGLSKESDLLVRVYTRAPDVSTLGFHPQKWVRAASLK